MIGDAEEDEDCVGKRDLDCGGEHFKGLTIND